MKTKGKIRCALISIDPFPIGNVSTVRYSSYMYALAKKGIFSEVIILTPSRTAAPNKDKEGVVNGVMFKYMSEITWRHSPTIIEKLCYYIYGLFASIIELKKNKINTIILYDNLPTTFIFYRLVSLLFSIKLLIDRSEYPSGYLKKSRYRQIIQRLPYKLFDGFIVMTKELVEFYSKIKSTKATIFHLPMTVDTRRFENITKQPIPAKYILVIVGSHNRDGLYESIMAYTEYYRISNNDKLRLKICGNFQQMPDVIKNKINEAIEQSGLKDMIDFMGIIPSIEVPQMLINAECLLTTPNSYVSGGFPTKLGEYLLSGVPVVATAAGEVGCYMEDGVSIFLLQPGDIKGIAKKIKFVQENREQALKIAEKGKELCAKVFHADTYVDELVEWMQSLKQ